MTNDEMVTIPLETLRHLYDLAMDSPLMCSGSFDSDDVQVLRATAERINVDPETATPDEFLRDYPHAFKPFNVAAERKSVETGRMVQSQFMPGHGWPETRTETITEVYARLGETPDRCSAPGYGRLCNRPAADPMHVTWSPRP